jgi:hypothetical protein
LQVSLERISIFGFLFPITIAIQRNEESGRGNHINNDDQVIVRIKDTGTRIDPEIMPRLFTKFATKSVTGTCWVCSSQKVL